MSPNPKHPAVCSTVCASHVGRPALSRSRPGASPLPAGSAPEILLEVLGVVPLGAASGCCAASSATTCARGHQGRLCLREPEIPNFDLTKRVYDE